MLAHSTSDGTPGASGLPPGTVEVDLSLFSYQEDVFWCDAPNVVYPKGRRAGGTDGAARAILDRLLKIPNYHALWVDKNFRNIQKYVKRYFLPRLGPLPNWRFSFNGQLMVLSFWNGSYIDFVSCSHPEDAEGQAYNHFIINEAGHVLKDEELYYYTLLPMGIEGEGSTWWYVGAPKGPGLFKEFYDRGLDPNEPDWASFRHPSTINPVVNKEFLARVVEHMPDLVYRQEILAEFVDYAGAVFNREWFEIVPFKDYNPGGALVRYWDCAATKQKDRNDPDYTTGPLMARSPDGYIYILDFPRFREEAGGVDRRVKACDAADDPAVIYVFEEEPGSSGKTTTHHFKQLLPNRAVIGDRPSGPKEQRAIPLAGYAQAGKIRLIRGPWNERFLAECVEFPEGRHDDQVDAAAGGFQFLMRGGDGSMPVGIPSDADWEHEL